MLRHTARWLLVALGWSSLGMGVLGVFLPLLPTTPLVLLAAFFFSRGSERLHRWLVEHPAMGRYIRDWEAEQVVPPLGKYAATITMIPMVSWAILTRDIPLVVELTMGVVTAGTLWFIWTRPSRRSVRMEQFRS
jgi:uncharacterized membrane protein YbaN (DUF454 family)